jgi:DNA-binding protein HU-beta
LKKGGRVSRFGSSGLYLLELQEIGRNPNSKTIKLPAKNVVKFKAGAELEGAVN